MPDLNQNEIAAAKKRIEEMRSRANSYVKRPPDTKQERKNAPGSAPPVQACEETQQTSSKQSTPFDSIFSILSSSDNSSALILALILILSREKADNMLILALLYILL